MYEDDPEQTLTENRDELIRFAMRQLAVNQPRGNYKELLELCIIFLGVVPPRGIRFHVPGAYHRAWWMAKAIYAHKIWMFRNQFKLTAHQEKGLKRVKLFVVQVYMKAWFTAPSSVQSPRNDLELLKNLQRYKDSNVTRTPRWRQQRSRSSGDISGTSDS